MKTKTTKKLSAAALAAGFAIVRERPNQHVIMQHGVAVDRNPFTHNEAVSTIELHVAVTKNPMPKAESTRLTRGPVNGKIGLPGTNSTVTFIDRGTDVRVVHATPGIEERIIVSRKRARHLMWSLVASGYTSLFQKP